MARLRLIRGTRMGLEKLESREVRAVGLALSSGVLTITGDSWNNHALVSLVNNKVNVRVESVPSSGTVLTPSVKTGSYSGVSQIKFFGNAGDDWFDSTFIYPCYIEGGSGNDELEGGGGKDTILGNDGDDILRGVGGDDALFGGDGIDKLYGGSGNDSLHGGGGTSADKLWGGTGRDRFLTQTNDSIQDGSGLTSLTGEDVQLRFLDSSSASWSNLEIQKMDAAFQQLFDATGNNRLLRDSTKTAPLAFTQEDIPLDPQGNRTLATNSDPYLKNNVWYSGPWWNRTQHIDRRSVDRKIVIDEWNENDAAETKLLQSTLIHELGHNWDSAEEKNTRWQEFLNLSGWRGTGGGSNYYLSGDGEWNYLKSKSTGFFGSVVKTPRGNSLTYGKWNPREDFATTWAHYFDNKRSTSHSNSIAAAKLAVVDKLVKSFR